MALLYDVPMIITSRTLTLAENGALVIPPDVLADLFVTGCTFAIEVDETANTVLVRPLPPEGEEDDAWAYTPDFIERSKRASANIRAGRLVEMDAERLSHWPV
jgi:hypothetical protein